MPARSRSENDTHKTSQICALKVRATGSPLPYVSPHTASFSERHALMLPSLVNGAAGFGSFKTGGIPNLPFLVVCPNTLVLQWAYEARRMLNETVWNILPYPDTTKERGNFWTNVYDATGGKARTIVIIPHSVSRECPAPRLFKSLVNITRRSPATRQRNASRSRRSAPPRVSSSGKSRRPRGARQCSEGATC